MAGGGMQSPSTLGGIPGIPQRGKQGIVAPLGGDPIAGGTLPGIETATAMGMPPRGGQGLAPGGATAGPQPGGAGMGAPAGLSPEVLQMIQAALGGQMPLGAAGTPPRAGGPAGVQTLPGGPAVPQRGGGPAGFITPPGGAAVPQRGGAGTGPPHCGRFRRHRRHPSRPAGSWPGRPRWTSGGGRSTSSRAPSR